MNDSLCRGCGLPLRRGGRRRQLKWCSEKCRKRTTYGGICEACGAETSGVEGGHAKKPRFCIPCASAKTGRERSWSRYEQVAELRAQGLLNTEIAQRLGISASAVATAVYRAREVGFEIRRTTYGPAAARASR